MSAARNDEIDRRMSVQSYFELENSQPDTRFEYIDGEILMMSGGSVNHGLISMNTGIYLGQALHDSPCRVFGSDVRVKLNASRYVYPDLTISCAQQEDDDKQSVAEPNFVMEVLSPSTAGFDRGLKSLYYRKCPSITTILLVEQDMPLVEVYRRQSSNTWTITTYDLDGQIALDTLGITIPVAEIYHTITFPQTPEEDV
jgi:Uma2 family endonuclease